MILFVPKAGLGNRVRGIASAYRLAKSIDEELHILWIDNHECNCSMTKLFRLPDEVKVTHIPWIPVPLNIRMHIQDLIRKFYQRKCDRVLLNEDLWDMEPGFIEALKKHRVYIETAAGWDCEADDSFDIIQINSDIVDKAKAFWLEKKVSAEDVVGIHIRRTDMENAEVESPREAFERVIEEELNNNLNTYFYLASDDENEKDYFMNRFGIEVIITRDMEMNRESEDGIQEAMLDIVLLSMCRKIYGTKGSSFSSLAAAIGKKSFTVVTE